MGISSDFGFLVKFNNSSDTFLMEDIGVHGFDIYGSIVV